MHFFHADEIKKTLIVCKPIHSEGRQAPSHTSIPFLPHLFLIVVGI